MKTVILADDHEMFLQGLTSLVETISGYEVISTSADGEAALSQIQALQPHVAIVDSSMPKLSGVEVMEEATVTTKFVLLTMFTHPQLLADAREAGVSACVSKKDAARELADALAAVDRGEFFASSTMRDMLTQIESGHVIGLTKREREIMHAVVDGRTNKEIARNLGIAVKTVDTHRERLMKKIGAHNSADIVRYAMQMGVGMI
ncbi:MAG: response regulator transcription factor [Verrucomicrobiota bacterium]